MTLALEVRDLTAGYGPTMILQDVNLEVGEHEIVCIAGPNGAGKSTLLKAVSGLIPWQRGEVSIFGTVSESGRTDDDARAMLGYVPQLKNLFPSLTVEENLKISLPRRWKRSQTDAALGSVYEKFPRVEQVRRKLGTDLSGGQRQSVAFAMAYARRPQLMLLDEPSAALAPNLVDEVFSQIAELRTLGIAVLLVEQNVRAALAISDRAYFLESGRNALDGRVDDIKDDPRIRKVYLGSM